MSKFSNKKFSVGLSEDKAANKKYVDNYGLVFGEKTKAVIDAGRCLHCDSVLVFTTYAKQTEDEWCLEDGDRGLCPGCNTKYVCVVDGVDSCILFAEV